MRSSLRTRTSASPAGTAPLIYGWPAVDVIGKRTVDVIPVRRDRDDLTPETLLALLTAQEQWRGELVQQDRVAGTWSARSQRSLSETTLAPWWVSSPSTVT